MKWIKRPISDSYNLFVKNGYSRVIATTLATSGISTLEDAKEFLESKTFTSSRRLVFIRLTSLIKKN